MELKNRYEILEEIGAGSFGMVYLARDNQTHELVAIKRVV